MNAALPAFLIEAVFYLGSLFEETREWFGMLQPSRLQALLLWVSALLPYLVLSLIGGTFQRNAFYLIAMLTALLAFWHAVLPRRLAYDVGFFVIAAAPIVTRVFTRLYVAPELRPQMDILGHLMWIRLGIAALLVLRGWDPGPFGFWPKAHEWKIGTFFYLLGIVPIIGVALLVRDVRYAPLDGAWWRMPAEFIGTFFGMLWVVALSEELLFRGVVERALLPVWRSPLPAILISAVIFGCAHLWFHGFPNWHRPVVALVLGIMCGFAYQRTGSIRTSMVTHALVVATWRAFFA